MNLFNSIKNKKGAIGAIGAVSAGLIILALAFAIVSVSYVKPVLAVHDSIITITPNIANCDELGNTFTVNVKNSESSADDIFEVRIYDESYAETYGIVEFHCGPAPVGWQLFDYTIPGPNYYGYCEYKTQQYGAYVIEPGENVDFTFDAVMSQEKCYSKFLVSTLDNKQPEGEHEYHTPQVDIDCSNPLIDKQVGEPKISGTGFDWWITQNTNIHLSASDNTGECDLGLDYCQYRWSVDGGEPTEWIIKKDGKVLNWDFKFGEDSNHHLEVECYDIANNKATLTEDDKVDSTPPVTEKKYGTPFYSDGTFDWININTPIKLEPKDGGDICAIGLDFTKYRYCLNPDCYEQFAEKGKCYCPEETPWVVWDGTPFNILQDSEHCIQFYSGDDIGNIENIKSQCVYVDNTKPTLWKEHSPGMIEDEDSELGVFNWMTQDMTIDLYCSDQYPHPVDKVHIWYRTWNDITKTWSVWTDPSAPEAHKQIKFGEDSVHKIQYYCVDELGNSDGSELEPYEQTYKVDSTPPKITKTMIGEDHLGDCPPGPSPAKPCYVRDDGENGVHIAVSDGGAICAVDQTTCSYGLWWLIDQETCEDKYGKDAWDGTKCKVDSGSFGEEGKNIIFREDSEHRLFIQCRDALNNWNSMDIETFLVDSTPPETIKTYGDPHYPSNINDPAPYPHWITTDTSITLKATDNKVGVDKIYWIDIVVEDRYCNSEYSGCQNYQFPEPPQMESQAGDQVVIKKTEESCHLLQFYAVDKLGNAEQPKRQCVFVDITPPKTVKTFDGLVVEKGGYKYINQNTEIKLTCNDQLPHPVDHSAIKYRYRFANDCKDLGSATWSEWLDPNGADPVIKTITFTEDSCHELEYYCVDALGNKEDTQSEIDIVDTKAPVIEKDIDGPHYGDCPPEYSPDGSTHICYIDGITEIDVTVTDSEPHPVNDVTCRWGYTVDGGDFIVGGQGLGNQFVVKFPEESMHNLIIECKDALGNKVHDEETFFVDKTPPAISKKYSEPFESYQFDTYWAKWISSKTTITAGVTDDGEHKSGIQEVKYRVTMVNDEDCKYYYAAERPETYECDETGPDGWTYVDSEDFDEFTFNIDEDSCHLIEIMATDNVDKCSLHKQWVYVDNVAPDVFKEVGEPKEEWEGDNTFYENLIERCAEGDIECWKVTLGTPLNLTCDDSWNGEVPHPVDHDAMCFQIELDGDDVTNDEKIGYCDCYSGEMKDGWCCVEGGIPEFHFKEESQHDLKVKCIDALGNEGEIDEEKFKVEGCTYPIPLEKKWNLISVPFKLLNAEPDLVFEDVTEEIESVWTYHDEKWYLWTPEDGGTLNSIEPGWGYWILANDEATLEIAGSLMSPKTVPPSRELEEGWNLIGYYGNTLMQGENVCNVIDTDTFQVGQKPGQCIIESKPVYCALNSLVDTQEGFPRWSSLYEYYNFGGDNAGWNGLDACIGKKWNAEYMKPGQGYWIEMDVQDGYAPATNCIWNTDLKCVPEFPLA